MPRSGGSHRHPAQHYPISVDMIISTDILNGLKDIGLASPAITVLYSAERMEFDVAAIFDVPTAFITFIEGIDEIQFAQSSWMTAPMQNNIQAYGNSRIVVLRNDEPIWLH